MSPKPDNGRWTRRRARDPAEQRDIDWDRRDKQCGEPGRHPLLRNGYATVPKEQQTSADNERIPPRRRGGCGRAAKTRDREQDHAGEKEPHARHQERWNRLDREKNPEIGRAPDQIERRKGEDDRDLLWLSGHQLWCHDRDAHANAVPKGERLPVILSPAAAGRRTSQSQIDFREPKESSTLLSGCTFPPRVGARLCCGVPGPAAAGLLGMTA